MTERLAVVRYGRAWLPVIALTSAGSTAAMLAVPALTGAAVDAIVEGDNQTAARRSAIIAAVVAAAVLCDIVGTVAGAACVARTTARLRRRLVAHLLGTGPSGAGRFETGDLVTRVTTNAAEAAQTGPAAVAAVLAIVPPVGSIVLLWVIDARLAAAFLSGAALVVLVLWAFARRTARSLDGYATVQGTIASRLTESLGGARTVAAAATAGREADRILAPLPQLRAYGTDTWRALAGASWQAGLLAPAVLVAVLAVGGFGLIDGRITVGQLLTAGQYASSGVGLGGLTAVIGRLARTRTGRRRVGQALAVPLTPYGTRRSAPGPGTLEFRAVRAGAVTLDVTVPGGRTVAVVGRSGSGKSTLAALAARLREPDHGTVLLDGVPLRELCREELRTAVGCAFERPVLVGATVGAAIGLGAGREQVVAAARATHAHDFVSRLPAGYDTPLIEAPMSGGEAQRIGLARAWHAQRVLVLDDATASLDMVTEMQIARSLDADHAGRTRLVITHRLTTAARADLVLWLDDGRVRDLGPHRRLWQTPEYREVFR